jgi:hypothetical protein
MIVDEDNTTVIPDDSDSAMIVLNGILTELTSEDPISQFDCILKIFLGSPSGQKPPYAEDIQYHTRHLLMNCMTPSVPQTSTTLRLGSTHFTLPHGSMSGKMPVQGMR